MKRLIRATKFYSPYLNEDEYQDRLEIPSASVRNHILDDADDKDTAVLEYLIFNRVFPTVASSAELRNNPYYSLEDKFIHRIKSGDDYRVYSIPYAGGGRWDTGKIFTKDLTVYDDGSFKFGDNRQRRPNTVAISTLKNDFFRS